MSNHLFFLSYARLDRDEDKHECIRTFYQDLVREVRMQKGIPEENIGFFDGSDIEPGEVWPERLVQALCTSRAFIPIYSPTYFTKEYCGKEWAIFRSRLNRYTDNSSEAPPPPLILPVLLLAPDQIGALPQAATEIQYMHDDFPSVYVEEGLRYMMRLTGYKDDYERFLTKFARKLIRVIDTYHLPPAQGAPDIKRVGSAFQQLTSVESTEIDSPVNTGPRFVQFVFVAGRRDEIRRLRQQVDSYGQEGGMDWRPYLPEIEDEVAIIAQDVAVREKLRYEAIKLDEHIIQRLEEAEQSNKIVAIVVDTWTLRLQHYHTFMREYDRRSFLNCVVLVPWNNRDNETSISRAILEDAVQITFLNNTLSKDPHCFLDSIGSYEEFIKQLSAALNKAKMRIIEKGEVIKKAYSEQIISKPIIAGPTGKSN